MEDGFILDKKIGVGQPKKIQKARVLVCNTAMDSDKIKIFGAGVKVESVTKLAEIEKAERKKMKDKVSKMLDHKMKYRPTCAGLCSSLLCAPSHLGCV